MRYKVPFSSLTWKESLISRSLLLHSVFLRRLRHFLIRFTKTFICIYLLEQNFVHWDKVNFLVLFDRAEVAGWECRRFRVVPQISVFIGDTCFVNYPTMFRSDAEDLDFVIRVIGFCEFLPVHSVSEGFWRDTSSCNCPRLR
nr:MAG TPA: hypothetical protein [Caudoviricetes sp.]